MGRRSLRAFSPAPPTIVSVLSFARTPEGLRIAADDLLPVGRDRRPSGVRSSGPITDTEIARSGAAPAAIA